MDTSQLIVFTLGEEEYAINICYAQEIIRIPSLTQIPNTPSFLEGVFSLRGKVIPVIDLKKRFGINGTYGGNDSRLLILDFEGMKIGIIVDDVSEVMKISSDSIKNLDDEIAGISKNSIEGVCLIDKRIIILLNISKLITEIFKINLEKENA